MSSVTFYKICELLLVVIYAFGADYMMTSVLGRRFVPKRKIPFFNYQKAGIHTDSCDNILVFVAREHGIHNRV